MAMPNGLIIGGYIARYRGDSTLATLLGNPQNPPGGIFDGGAGIPTLTPPPYVALYIPESTTGTTLAMGQDAVDSYLYVNIFSQPGAGGGMKQARDIAAQVYELTQTRPLDLLAQGFAQFFALFQNAQELPPKEGNLICQITQRYKLMTQTL